MTKTADKELATRIVDQLATVESVEGVDNLFTVSVPLIGHSKQYFNKGVEKFAINAEGDEGERDVILKTTKKQALELAAADIAEQLSNDEIVLADGWAENNLKG